MTEPLRVATVITRLDGGAGAQALRGARAMDPDKFRLTIITSKCAFAVRRFAHGAAHPDRNPMDLLKSWLLAYRVLVGQPPYWVDPPALVLACRSCRRSPARMAHGCQATLEIGAWPRHHRQGLAAECLVTQCGRASWARAVRCAPQRQP